jgi:P27 family predicted phage terminase small subunit
LKKLVTTPKTLDSEAKAVWRKLVAEYDIQDEGGYLVLQAGLEAFSRMRECQKQIGLDGITTTDRFGQVKAHPLLACERDARAQYLAALKALNLDMEPANHVIGRPGGA